MTYSVGFLVDERAALVGNPPGAALPDLLGVEQVPVVEFTEPLVGPRLTDWKLVGYLAGRKNGLGRLGKDSENLPVRHRRLSASHGYGRDSARPDYNLSVKDASGIAGYSTIINYNALDGGCNGSYSRTRRWPRGPGSKTSGPGAGTPVRAGFRSLSTETMYANDDAGNKSPHDAVVSAVSTAFRALHSAVSPEVAQ